MLTGNTFPVNIPILLGIPWDAWLEAQVSFVLYIDGTPIAARGALGGMGALLNPAAFERVAVFMGRFCRRGAGRAGNKSPSVRARSGP